MVKRNERTPLKQNKLLKTPDELAKIRRLNKSRAKSMEKEVCKFLGADRTPMSGAGFVKGDGILPLPNDMGIAVIECKVSEATHDTKGPFIRLQVEWVEKLRSDTDALKALGARFGFIVLKWHTWREKAVCIPVEYIPRIEKIIQREIPRNGIVMRAYTKDNKPNTFIAMYRKEYLESIGGTIQTRHGDLYLTSIEQLKEWLNNVPNL